jgi:hypothetical protein
MDMVGITVALVLSTVTAVEGGTFSVSAVVPDGFTSMASSSSPVASTHREGKGVVFSMMMVSDGSYGE